MDTDALVRLYAQAGDAGAEDVMARTVAAIVGLLADIGRAACEMQFRRLCHAALRLADQSDSIGMTSLALAARHLATASTQQDETAVEATLARLHRLADVSFAAVWNLRAAVH